MFSFVFKFIDRLQHWYIEKFSKKPNPYKTLYEETLKENKMLRATIDSNLIELKLHHFTKQDNNVLLKNAEVLRCYMENAIISLVNRLYMTEDKETVTKLMGGIKALGECRAYFLVAEETGKLPSQQ